MLFRREEKRHKAALIRHGAPESEATRIRDRLYSMTKWSPCSREHLVSAWCFLASRKWPLDERVAGVAFAVGLGCRQAIPLPYALKAVSAMSPPQRRFMMPGAMDALAEWVDLPAYKTGR